MEKNETKQCSCGKHESRKEHEREWRRQYWQKNRLKFSERKKKYYQNNKEKIKSKRMKNYYADHDRGKLQVRQSSKRIRQKMRSIILWYFGYRCNHCGYNKDARALHLDHINGGGSQEAQIRRGSELYRYYYRKPSLVFQRFQCLCANCNFVKRIESGEIKSSF